MKLKKYLLAPVLAAALVVSACNTSWIQTAEQYISVLTPVVGDILQVLVLTGVALPANSQVQVVKYSAQATSDLNTINTLLEDYQAANATTTFQKIDAAAEDAKTNLNAILVAAHVVDPKSQAKVSAAINLAVDTLTELEGLVPNGAQPAKLSPTAIKFPSPKDLQKQFHDIFSK